MVPRAVLEFLKFLEFPHLPKGSFSLLSIADVAVDDLKVGNSRLVHGTMNILQPLWLGENINSEHKKMILT
jgi:hypothetical protein